MNLLSFAAKLNLCLMLGWMAFPQISFAEDDVHAQLEALRKKVAAKETAQDMQSQAGRQSSLQLKLLQGAIARAQYEDARQMLRNFGGYGLPPEFHEEWLQLVDLLGAELEKRQAEIMKKWRSEVDQLVADTKKSCLEAKNSADLDPLLVLCAALQMRREQQNNVLGERTYRKLSGAAGTLTMWANYLDFRDAGNIKKANETLRGLKTNDSQFPVLTASEIEARFLTDDSDSLNVRTAMVKIFDGVKTPDDLPAALDRLRKYSSNPMNPELGSLRSEQRRIETIQQAWEALEKGDETTALTLVGRINASGGSEDASSYYEPFKDQILTRVLEKKAQKWPALSQKPGEDPKSYLERILVELQSRGDFASIVEVMRLADRINRTNQTQSFARECTAIEQFLAARRFENVGDDLAAVTNYRLVVGSPSGKYVPIAQAEEALKKLGEKNPEIFKNYDGALMEELRGLRQQIQMLLGRVSGGRFPPYPGQ